MDILRPETTPGGGQLAAGLPHQEDGGSDGQGADKGDAQDQRGPADLRT